MTRDVRDRDALAGCADGTGVVRGVAGLVLLSVLFVSADVGAALGALVVLLLP